MFPVLTAPLVLRGDANKLRHEERFDHRCVKTCCEPDPLRRAPSLCLRFQTQAVRRGDGKARLFSSKPSNRCTSKRQGQEGATIHRNLLSAQCGRTSLTVLPKAKGSCPPTLQQERAFLGRRRGSTRIFISTARARSTRTRSTVAAIPSCPMVG